MSFTKELKMIRWFKYEWIYLRRIKLTPRGLLILLLVLRDSLRWCFDINISNHLSWDGQKYFVNNGNTMNYWDCLLLDKDNKIVRDDRGVADTTYLPRTGVKKVYYWNTPFKDFMQGFRFYMGYWYCIWVAKGVSKYKERPYGIRPKRSIFTTK